MNTPASLKHPMPPALPADILDWHRAIKVERTLNDLVEDIHRVLVDDDKYRALLRAVYDEQAVEGSLSADNTLAAMMIRERALKTDSEVGHEKLATISKALGTVLRRYKASRKQRRNMVAGEEVSSDNGD
jgi:hypothetical protein